MTTPNHVKESLPPYAHRVLFFKPGPNGGWGKEWLIGCRNGTDADGEYWKSESYSGRLYDITHWCELPALPGDA